MEQSNGFLPLAPLRHADPTAVTVWDMDGSTGLAGPVSDRPTRARDQLVLVRLHQQPVAILHVQTPPGEEDRAGLLRAAWDAGAHEILAHVDACRCLPAPADGASLSSILDASSGRCDAGAPPRPPGRAAVVVCTAGRPDVLARALRSLARMSCDDFEVIVVDNLPAASATRELVDGSSWGIPIRYVAEARPGLSRARNAGIDAAAGASYVAFTDDDVVVDPGWLAWLLAPFNDQRVQTVTGLVMPLSLDTEAEKRFEQYAGFGKGVRAEIYDLGAHRAAGRFLYPYWGGMFGSGNSMAFRREALLSVGGFDVALGAGTPTGGGEDLAAFTDVILGGGRLVYEPRSVCWHEHRSDERSLRRQVHNYGVGLTAVLWRYFRRDWRFTATVVRSLPAIARLIGSRSTDRHDDRLPRDLARLELRGRLLGPWRYTSSSRRARQEP